MLSLISVGPSESKYLIPRVAKNALSPASRFGRFILHPRRICLRFAGESHGLTEADLLVLQRELCLKDIRRISLTQFTEGFCNSVFKITSQDGVYVVKKYSALSKMRTGMQSCVQTHRALAGSGLTPLFVASTEDIIVSQYLEGDVLREESMTNDTFHEPLAALITTLHSLEMADNDALIWSWLHQMTLELQQRKGAISGHISLQELTEEIFRVESIFQKVDIHVCFCHGDLKPSNIIHEQKGSMKLIDIDLAGPNYRGFDSMKLFRTSEKLFYDAALLSFLDSYHRRAELSKFTVSELFYEAQMCEVLTWLEAALFFATLSTMDTETERNAALFHDRWSHYRRTRWKLEYFGNLLQKRT